MSPQDQGEPKNEQSETKARGRPDRMLMNILGKVSRKPFLAHTRPQNIIVGVKTANQIASKGKASPI